MHTMHIGAAGELLVQYQLLKLGIDSARLTTDAGIDLVVYAPANQAATTVQVKTVRQPVPAGGKGAPALGWRFPGSCEAQTLALARLDQNAVWIFTIDEARSLAQQHAQDGSRQLYWFADRGAPRGHVTPRSQEDMDEYRLELRAPSLFPG